jgi:YD repeat-containing protein
VTTTTYDDYDRVVSVSNALHTTNISYSYAAGKLTTTTTKVIPSTGNQVSSLVTNAVGRVLTATDYGGSLDYLYHVMGMPLEVKQGSTTLVTYSYDDYARKTQATEINSGTIKYEYDAYGQLVSETNQLGHTTTNTYNDLGQIVSKTGAEGTTT